MDETFDRTAYTYKPVEASLLSEFNSLRNAEDKACFCFAPLRSMYFSFHGDVYSCCENLSYDYGTYPEESIHDIWFGEKRKNFLEHILHNDLSLGCSICEHYLKIKNFKGVKSRFYDNAPVAELYPSRLEFQLSNTCNLECAMCDGWSSSLIRKNRDKLPTIGNPYDDDFVRQLEEFIPHLKQAHFVGGEPFVISIFYKIWDKIIALNPECLITVQTNATVLNDRIKTMMEKANFSVNVSLDSLKKDTYEKIRKNASFEKTMENINWFMDYCKRKDSFFYFTPCPMQWNWEELPELINYANIKEVRIIFHTVLYPHFASLFGLRNGKLGRIYKKLAAVKLPETTVSERFNKDSYDAILYQLKNFYNDKSKKKEWRAFEKGQKEEIKKQRRDLKKQVSDERKDKWILKKQQSDLLREEKKLNDFFFIKWKLLLKISHKSIGNNKGFDTDATQGASDHCLKLFLWKRINEAINDIYNKNIEEQKNTYKLCEQKFELFFNKINDIEKEKDIISTIYTTTTLPQIITSLLTDDEEKLYEGYLLKKNKKNQNHSNG